MIIWPSLISTLLRIDLPSQLYIDFTLEKYYARALGLSQLALAGLLLVFSGVLPLDISPSSYSSSSPSSSPSNPTPLARAAVLVTSLHHTATAAQAWTRYTATGGRQTGYALGALGSGLLAAFGLWVLLFAGEGGRRVSRRTGADKSVSGWPFRNAVAEKKKKR